jgi:endogenous inhibitor of DNA gyrase (YacG/DUF329 family)
MNPRGSKSREVRCPGCGGPSLYAPENPWRPFCSERCRNQDFGAWESERYRVPEKTNSGGDDSSPSDLDPDA